MPAATSSLSPASTAPTVSAEAVLAGDNQAADNQRTFTVIPENWSENKKNVFSLLTLTAAIPNIRDLGGSAEQTARS